MKWSTLTLGSVEFLDMVGGDLEVPPDEYLEVEDEASWNLVESGERSPKWAPNSSSLSLAQKSPHQLGRIRQRLQGPEQVHRQLRLTQLQSIVMSSLLFGAESPKAQLHSLKVGFAACPGGLEIFFRHDFAWSNRKQILLSQLRWVCWFCGCTVKNAVEALINSFPSHGFVVSLT